MDSGCEKNEWYEVLLIIPLVVGIFAVIVISMVIVDLISWYVSPLAQAITVITQ